MTKMIINLFKDNIQRNKVFILTLLIMTLAMSTTLSAQMQDWQFNLASKYYGPTISLDGVEFNSGVSFTCVAPGFTDQYFYLPKLPFKKQVSPKTLIISSIPEKPTVFFMNALKLENTGKRKMKISVDGKLTKNIEAQIEYIPLCIPAAFMAGAVVEANGRTVTIGGKDHLYSINKAAKKIIIKSKYGTIVIKVEQGGGLIMRDRRKKLYKRKELFLFMLPLNKLSPRRKRFKHVISIEAITKIKDFKPQVKLAPCKPLANETNILLTVKYRHPKERTSLYPKPKEINFGKNTIAVPKTVKITLKEFGEKHNFSSLLNELFVNFKAKYHAEHSQNSGFITIRKVVAPSSNKYDYYELNINNNGVVISAPTARGAYYALTTLVQLIDSNGELPEARIKDWADFEFRGIHIVVDHSSLKFHGALIRQLLAPLKLNHIIMECEYAKWPSHPEMHKSWGISVNELKQLVEIANTHFIDVSPLFQTFGHSQYLFNKGSNLDIAENPNAPYAYNVSNPRTYKVISELFQDMRKVFPASEYLHIGHDEITHKRQYPCRPENMGKSVFELFMQDLKFYQQYAAQNNIKLMMWDDMLSGRDPNPNHTFYKIQKQLDKDITIVVWDYKVKSDYPVMEMFLKNGNPVICATGHVFGKPDGEGSTNIINFTQSANKRKVKGMLQTTWTGYKNNHIALVDYGPEIWAYIQAGGSFWDAGTAFVDYYVPSWMTKAFDHLLKKQYPSRYLFSGSEVMFPVNLSSVANVILPPNNGLRPGAFTTPYGVLFELVNHNIDVAVAKVDNKLPLKIKIGEKAVAISFLLGGVKHKNPDIGTITVTTDLGEIVQPIKIRRETGNLRHELSKSGRFLDTKSRARYFTTRPVFAPDGKLTFWQYDLAVDGSSVKTITVSTQNNASLVVAGVTLIKK